MTPDSMHDFFVASTSVAGALIGLLFVAISVVGERLSARDELQIDRIRANGALTAFLNTLVVGLFALIPGQEIGEVAAIESGLGLLFVCGSLLSLVRARRARHVSRGDLRDAAFLASLLGTFVTQLLTGLRVAAHPENANGLHTLAILVVVCFTIGIARSWELIGAPSIALGHEVKALAREATHHDSDTAAPADS